MKENMTTKEMIKKVARLLWLAVVSTAVTAALAAIILMAPDMGVPM